MENDKKDLGKDLEEVISTLASKMAFGPPAEDAVQYSKAILNLASAYAVLKNLEH